MSFPLSVYRLFRKLASERAEEPTASVTKVMEEEERISFWISRVDNDVKYKGGDAARATESELFI